MKNGNLTFEQAYASARSYVGDEKRLAKLVAQARRDAETHYESLLDCWENLQILVRMIRAQMAGKYRVPLTALTMAIAAIIYFVSPFDVIPDSIPVFGFLDDAAVIALVVKSNRAVISNFRTWEVFFGAETIPFWQR
jgi:uncharacterized membrane protein YkvA (DUF1232 family)